MPLPLTPGPFHAVSVVPSGITLKSQSYAMVSGLITLIWFLKSCAITAKAVAKNKVRMKKKRLNMT